LTDKSRENATENVEILDTYKQNMLRTIDEISKYQPQYAQSISNIQQDYLQVTKELVNRMAAFQKSWYGNNARNSFSPIAAPYAEQYRKQSNEITSQAFHVFDTANQLAIDILNSIRENIKLLGKTFDTVTEYNENLADTWSNFYTSAQKQYSK
jgi:anaerobic ribonucleoside-triphosphate reductase